MGELTPAVRKALKARAHRLDPVVMIGERGLTGQVIAEIDRALNAHELIKIAARAMERGEREAAMREICARTGALAVQHIGKVLVVYRERAEEGRTERTQPRARRATRSARPGFRSASRRPASAPRPRRRPPSRSGRARSAS